MSMEMVSVVCAVNDEKVYQNNLLASPFLSGSNRHQIIARRGFSSASKAYNSGIEEAENDLIVFAHQDVFFPAGWLQDLVLTLEKIEKLDQDWGVLGSFGVTGDREFRGHVYSAGLRRILGEHFDAPVEVQTLDELVLIVRKSSGLRFDESLPYFHFYGADICMAAHASGRRSYAIPAFCIHNSNQVVFFPPEFYACWSHFRKRWAGMLPVQTTCATVSGSATSIPIRKFKEKLRQLQARLMGIDPYRKRNLRLQDPRTYLEHQG